VSGPDVPDPDDTGTPGPDAGESRRRGGLRHIVRAAVACPGPIPDEMSGCLRPLSLRPVQWLGDISYSVYLWHWPLIVLVPDTTGHPLTWLDRGAIVVGTLVLARLTKLFVEDRFRAAQWGVPLRKPFALAAAAMAVVVGLAGVQLVEVTQRTDRAAAALARGLAGHSSCFGARALDHPTACPPVAYADVVPAPITPEIAASYIALAEAIRTVAYRER